MPPAQTDYSGQTALHVAASNGCMKAARYLVRRGASPKARDGPLTDGELPWEVAARWGEHEVAEFLHDALHEAQRQIAIAAKLHRSVV